MGNILFRDAGLRWLFPFSRELWLPPLRPVPNHLREGSDRWGSISILDREHRELALEAALACRLDRQERAGVRAYLRRSDFASTLQP